MSAPAEVAAPDIQAYMASVTAAAHAAARAMARSGTAERNAALEAIARALDSRRGELAEANERDLEAGRTTGLDAATLAGCAAELGGVDVEPQATVADAMVAAGIVDSKGAARRAVKEGGAYVNNAKVEDAELPLESLSPLAGGWLVVRRGKKTVGMVQVTD